MTEGIEDQKRGETGEDPLPVAFVSKSSQSYFSLHHSMMMTIHLSLFEKLEGNNVAVSRVLKRHFFVIVCPGRRDSLYLSLRVSVFPDSG